MQMSHGWCLRLELRCYLHLRPLFVSLSKGKARLSKNEEANSSVTKSENKQEAEEMQGKGSPCQRLNSGTLCWLQSRPQHWLCQDNPLECKSLFLYIYELNSNLHISNITPHHTFTHYRSLQPLFFPPLFSKCPSLHCRLLFTEVQELGGIKEGEFLPL